MRVRRMSSHSRVSETLPKDGRCAGSGTFRGNQFARFLPHPCHSVKESVSAVDIGDVGTLKRGYRSEEARQSLPTYNKGPCLYPLLGNVPMSTKSRRSPLQPRLSRHKASLIRFQRVFTSCPVSDT